MRLDEVRAVVFDLDDTLYPERDYTRSGARAVACYLEATSPSLRAARVSKRLLRFSAGNRSLTARGPTGALAELLALEEQDPAGPLYSRWLDRRGLDAASRLPELLRVHREHAPELALAADVRESLVRLRKRCRLGLVSDGRLAQQQAKAQALGLAELLDALVFSDELGAKHWKPHPAPYWRALELLGVPPAQAVYVGDNPAKDFLGARRAGMRSLRLRRCNGLHAKAEPVSAEAAPDAEIRALSELEPLLGLSSES